MIVIEKQKLIDDGNRRAPERLLYFYAELGDARGNGQERGWARGYFGSDTSGVDDASEAVKLAVNCSI